MDDKQIKQEQIQMKLRSQARKMLEDLTPNIAPGRTPEEMLHELQVHQLELEQQNEELRRANSNLEEFRNRHLDLYEFTPIGYVTLTYQERISEISLNGAALLGDERGNLFDCSFTRFVAPQDSDCWHHHFSSTMKKGGKQSVELIMQRRDGSQFQARLNTIRLETAHTIPDVRIAITDISDMVELRRTIAETKIAAIVFESQHGMAITDANKVVLRINKAFTRIYGHAEQQIVGRRLFRLHSDHHESAFYDAIWERIEQSGSWQGEIWDVRKNGETFPSFVTIAAVQGDHGEVTHYVCTIIDITKRKAADDEILSLAFYDPLTRLPNRRLLLDRLRHAMTASARSKREGALMFIDLDDFKTLNDTLGHDMGDRLLIQVAEALNGCVREGDTVSRFGGDEFVVILEELSGNSAECANTVEHIAKKVLASLNTIAIHCKRQTAASIGITLFNGHENTVEELMKRADLAMYQAKSDGRNTLRFFDPEMQATVTARANMENDLREALANKEFVLYFQPQVNADGSLIGFETLVRWERHRDDIVLPSQFIYIAEQTGLIVPLGLWALESACAQLAAWTTNARTAGLSLSVNVSARQFQQPDFVEQVLATLDHSGANPRNLKLELTETVLLNDVKETIVKMKALKEYGVHFSLDDFGVGFASLSYLKRLPIDQLKIDQSFIQNVLTDSDDAAITKMVIALAHNMGIEAVAEGVETEGQRDYLARNGCCAYQGYLFSPPLPQEVVNNLLSQPHHTGSENLHEDSMVSDIKPRWDRRSKPLDVAVDRRHAKAFKH